MARHTLFATSARGLESALAEELTQLKFSKPEAQTGGARFEGTLQDVWRANLWLRSAGRVLMRVARFRAATDDSLYAQVKELPWETWLGPEGTLRVQAQLRDSNLTHSRFVEQRTKDGIVDRFREQVGARPSVGGEDSDLRVHVHLSANRATISLDTSGAPLFKRGWRQSGGIAPLRENLAAGILIASGWNRRAPVVDPFCGTGTFLIEAALMAGDIAPGLGRNFGFEQWKDHDAKAFAKTCDEARAAAKHPHKLRLLGMDRRRDRLDECRQNAESAGVLDRIEFEEADARAFSPRPGWNACIVTNPPYGARIEVGADLRALYAQFGARLQEHCAGYSLNLLTASGPLVESLGLPRLERVPVSNGPIECTLIRGEI